MSSAAQSIRERVHTRAGQIDRPFKRQRILDTILSESDRTIEGHDLCDHLFHTYTETNKRLRSDLVNVRVKLSGVERDYEELKAEHSQCPYWIQRNEKLVEALEDRCERLEQDNKKFQELCEQLDAQVRRLQEPSSRGSDESGRRADLPKA